MIFHFSEVRITRKRGSKALPRKKDPIALVRALRSVSPIECVTESAETVLRPFRPVCIAFIFKILWQIHSSCLSSDCRHVREACPRL